MKYLNLYLNHKRREMFAREFPWLDKIPGFHRTDKIKVSRLSADVLHQTGRIYQNGRCGHIEASTTFYVVFASSVVEGLHLDRFDTFSSRQTDHASTNGEQLSAMIGSPDFIVKCELEESGLITWTIYKCKKFNWDRHLSRFKPRLKAEPEEQFEQFV